MVKCIVLRCGVASFRVDLFAYQSRSVCFGLALISSQVNANRIFVLRSEFRQFHPFGSCVVGVVAVVRDDDFNCGV